MFIQFTKIDPSHPTITSQIIVNSDQIILVSTDNVRNLDTQSQYTAIRVDISGNPIYSFFTLSSIDDIVLKLPTIDALSNTGNLGNCLFFPLHVYSHVRLLGIHNFSSQETEELVINPNTIVWAEQTFYTDRVTKLQQLALQIILNTSPQKKILTTLPFSELANLIIPTII